VSVPALHLRALLNLARRLAVPAQVLGSVGGDGLIIAGDGEAMHGPWINVPVADLIRTWRGQREPVPC